MIKKMWKARGPSHNKMSIKKKFVTKNNPLLGKHVIMLSAYGDLKNVVEDRLDRLKQIASNSQDPDMYRVIPFGQVYIRITTLKLQGFIIVRKLLEGDRTENINPELAKAHKRKQLILSLWEGYQRNQAGRHLAVPQPIFTQDASLQIKESNNVY